MITEDLIQGEYVGDSGFIIDSFVDVRSSVELLAGEWNSTSPPEITGSGAHGLALSYPIDDAADARVRGDEIYIRRKCESDFPREEE